MSFSYLADHQTAVLSIPLSFEANLQITLQYFIPLTQAYN